MELWCVNPPPPLPSPFYFGGRTCMPDIPVSQCDDITALHGMAPGHSIAIAGLRGLLDRQSVKDDGQTVVQR